MSLCETRLAWRWRNIGQRMFVCCAFVGIVLPVHAEVYRCTDGAGRLTYQDHPCAGRIPASAPASAPTSAPTSGPASASQDANAAQTNAATLPALTTMAPPNAAVRKLAQQESAQEQAELRQHQHADAAWLKEYQRKQQKEEAIRKGLMENCVVIGMTPDQVERILNLPYKKEVSAVQKTSVASSAAVNERWYYVADGGQWRIITFKNGEVASDATVAPRRHQEHKLGKSH